MRFVPFVMRTVAFVVSAAPNSVTDRIDFGNVTSSHLFKIGCNFCQVVEFQETITSCPGPYLFVGGRRNEADLFFRDAYNMISAKSNHTSLEILGKFPPGPTFSPAWDKSFSLVDRVVSSFVIALIPQLQIAVVELTNLVTMELHNGKNGFTIAQVRICHKVTMS